MSSPRDNVGLANTGAVIRPPEVFDTAGSAGSVSAVLRRALLCGVLSSLFLWGTPVRGATAAFTAVPVRANQAIDETDAAARPGRFAWDQDSTALPGHFDLYAHVSGVTIRVNRPGTQGLGGGIDGSTIVFEQYQGGSDRTFLYDLSIGVRTAVSTLNAWSGPQYHPTMSGPWILLEREQSDGGTQVVLFNRNTQETRVIAHGSWPSSSVYAGQVNGNYAVWGRAAFRAWDVFVYDIAKGTQTRIERPASVAFQYSPAVTPDGTAYFARGGSGCGENARLVRRDPDGTIVRLLALPNLVDAGYTFAYPRQNGSTTLFFNRARCKDRYHYMPHPWDIYKIDDAAVLPPASIGSFSTRATSPGRFPPSGGQPNARSRWRSPAPAGRLSIDSARS